MLFRYQAFLTLRFWKIVQAKIKAMGCWVIHVQRPLLSTYHIVSGFLSPL